MNIALFGGSFDPPHVAHEQIALKALKSLDIDRLIITPSYLNPFKNEFHFSPKDRHDLIKELFKDQNKIEISQYECNQNKSTPTIDTVNYLLSIYDIKKFYLIIGEDNLYSLEKWKSFEELNSKVEFVVFSRRGFMQNPATIQYKKISLDIDISSTHIRDTKDLEHIPKQIQKKVKQLWNKE